VSDQPSEWMTCTAACPSCGERAVEVRQVLTVQKPGTFSLAGYNLKFPARLCWQYRCAGCGDTGPAEPS
jgi:hypothetical protein